MHWQDESNPKTNDGVVAGKGNNTVRLRNLNLAWIW